MNCTDNKDNVCFALRTVNNMIRRKLEAETVGEEDYGDLTPLHTMIINYLYLHSGEDVFQKDIASHFSIRRSTTTSVIQLMEKNGLIIRESVEGDARLKKLTLSERGEKLNERAHDALMQTEKALKEELTSEEEEMFFKIMQKFKRKLA